VTDGRYRDQANEQLHAAGVAARIEVSNTDQRDILRTSGAAFARIGLEAEDVSWAQYLRLDRDWFPDSVLVATNDVVDDLRLAKDAGEVARIEAAALVADHALATVRGRLLDGVSEQ